MLFVEEEDDSESGASSTLPSTQVTPASTISSTITASSGGTMKKAPSFVNMFTPPADATLTANTSTGSSMVDLASLTGNASTATSNSTLNTSTSSSLTRKGSRRKSAGAPAVPPPSANGHPTVLALYDYTAQVDGELTFKKGDYIEVTNKDIGSDAWWEGLVHGLKGQFPKAYVKELDAAKQPATPKLPRVEALYDYDGQYDGELRMRAGDIVELISKTVEGDASGDWWEGRLNGAKGQFPRSYVKEI